MSSRRVLVVGKSGQVARALARVSLSSTLSYRFAGRDDADLTDHARLAAAIKRVSPGLVINTAAYTAVDKAETDSTSAYAVNADGPCYLALLCAAQDVPLIHLSTDYVFDGTKNAPYVPGDATNPINVYGASKLAGEDAVRALHEKHVIVRLAWVYHESGANFVNTMLRLAKNQAALRVVDDQIGQPSYAIDIASAIDKIAANLLSASAGRPWGTYHLTNTGETSWFGFAEEIFDSASRFGWQKPSIIPIRTEDYPTPARRPRYSVLDTTNTAQQFGIVMPGWREALERCMAAICQPLRERQGVVT